MNIMDIWDMMISWHDKTLIFFYGGYSIFMLKSHTHSMFMGGLVLFDKLLEMLSWEGSI